MPDMNGDDARAASRVIKSGWVGPGEKVAEFEEKLAAWFGCNYCVCTSSGAAAIMAVLMQHAESNGNKLMIAPAYGHHAAINAGLLLGYKVILCDVSVETGCMYLDDLQYILRNGVSEQGGVLCYVQHNGWYELTTSVFAQIERKYRDRWTLLQDSCQSMHNRPELRGDTMVVSFSPQKIVTTGQGGAVLTDNNRLAASVRRLVSHGRDRENGSPHVGVNLRMSDVSAAIGLSQLNRIDAKIDRWRAIRGWYEESREWVWCPSVRTDLPDAAETALRSVLVDSGRLYTSAGEDYWLKSRTTAFGSLPASYKLAVETLYLPGHHKVRWQTVQKIKGALDGYR